MTRIFSIFVFALLLFGCNDSSVECKNDVIKDVTIQTCYGLDESSLLGGGEFTFVNFTDTIQLSINDIAREFNQLEFRWLVFSKSGRVLDATNFAIAGQLIVNAFWNSEIDSLTKQPIIDIIGMTIRGEYEFNSPIEVYFPCFFSLRSKEMINSARGIEYYRIELKHPNDYHGEQLICEGVEKVDLWMTNLEHPRIVALQYKGDIYTLRD